jgi:hypothetical protein
MVKPEVQVKKQTPSQKASPTQRKSHPVKDSQVRPSQVSRSSSGVVASRPVFKRPRELEKDEEDEEDEEEWEEVDEHEEASSLVDEEAEEAEEAEDEYSRLESEDDLSQLAVEAPRSRRKSSSGSKQPPKKVTKTKPTSWWDTIKKGVEKIPLFSDIQL